MTKVLVLGGGMVARTLTGETNVIVHAAGRSGGALAGAGIAWTDFDAERDPIDDLLSTVGAGWVINCIGVIKPKIDGLDSDSVIRAIAVNSVFSRRLSDAAARNGVRATSARR
jgi:hypothetical protein